mmetsp:Transcript_19750/g.47711  ORF Transcript_19750/g.47711 Transcript_19750/m.47711 type:complete len:546 (+) Transcript_19750:96-1733(+)
MKQQQQHHRTMPKRGDAPRVLPVAAMMMTIAIAIAIATGCAIDGIEAFSISRGTLQQRQRRLRSTATTAATTSTSLKYFDDCERKLEPFELILGQEGLFGRDFSSASPSPTRRSSITNMTFSQEKLLALDTLLGYNPTSASQLSDISVEEETLRWAVDTNVVWSPDEDYEEEDYKEDEDTSGHKASSPSAKYDKIQDLLVASECQTTLDSLVYFWRMLADTLSSSVNSEKDSPSSSSSSSSADGTTAATTTTTTKLVVFPQTESLWDYDQSVLLLQAIEICKPWFLPIDTTLRLDLFHPQYKYSPRMWSQETHSPFPTVGVVVGSSQPRREGQETKEHPLSSPLKQIVDNPVIDMEATKAKLNALFESVDAVAPTSSTRSQRIPTTTTCQQSSSENIKSRRQEIIEETRMWLSDTQQQEDCHRYCKNGHDDSSSEAWKVETETDPVQLYKTLWESIQSLVSSSAAAAAAQASQTNDKDTKVAAVVIIAPLFDGHTIHRVAVTVNAALKKLKIPVCVTRVNHPSSSTEKQQTDTAPYGLIELSLEQ